MDRLHPVLPGDDHRLAKRAGGPVGNHEHRPPRLEQNRVAYPCPELVVLFADARHHAQIGDAGAAGHDRGEKAFDGLESSGRAGMNA